MQDLSLRERVVAKSVSTTIAVSVAATIAISAAAGVGGAVAGSVAGSIAGSVAGSVAAGGATGASAAAGSAAASSGAAGGAAIPLILAAQRLSFSGGLAVKKSPVQSVVSNQLSWATGDIGFVSPEPMPDHSMRRLLLCDDITPSHATEFTDASASNNTDSTLEQPIDGCMLVHQIPPVVIPLLNMLATLALALGVALMIQAAAVMAWRHWVNRSYYSRIAKIMPNHESERVGATKASTGEPAPKFVGFPSPLISPVLVDLIISTSIAGIVRSSCQVLTAIYMGSDDATGCSAGCTVLPVACLVSVVLWLSLVLWRIENAMNYRRVMWKDSQRTPAPSDPFFIVRAVFLLQSSTILQMTRGAHRRCDDNEAARVPREQHTHQQVAARISGKDSGVAVDRACLAESGQISSPPPLPVAVNASPRPKLKRAGSLSQLKTTFRHARASARLKYSSRGFHDASRGAFKVPAASLQEPERTERLLHWHRYLCPMLMPSNPGDKYEVLTNLWLFRVSGQRRVQCYYQFAKVLLNCSLALLTGIGAALPHASPKAMAQLAITMCLQLGMAGYILCLASDSDRVMGCMSTIMFLTEGLATAALILSSLGLASDAVLQNAALILSLCGVVVPVFTTIYNGSIRPVITLLRHNGCGLFKSVVVAHRLLFSVPNMVNEMTTRLCGASVCPRVCVDGCTSASSSKIFSTATKALGVAKSLILFVMYKFEVRSCSCCTWCRIFNTVRAPPSTGSNPSEMAGAAGEEQG